MQVRPSSWTQSLRVGWVFSIVVLWKLSLLAFCALPPPANDAFFFDGAIVNWLSGGGYFNPTIVRMFPTSGADVFCAYPPFYQAVLAVWMMVAGTSAKSALLLHGTLFAGFALLALALLRRLGASARAINFGGCFLLAMTFHDRPDSVAHVAGMLALLAWVVASQRRAAGMQWAGALMIVLTVATSLHIGAMYAAVCWIITLLRGRQEPRPWLPMLAMILLPVAAVAGVIIFVPRWWEGFGENLRVTPSLTGYRVPTFEEVLKIVRTAPGLLLVGAAMLFTAPRIALRQAISTTPLAAQVFVAVLAGGLFTVWATLFVVAANYVNVAAYPQVLAVGMFTWLILPALTGQAVGRWVRTALIGAIALVSIRAVGLSTWGIVCAIDVGAAEARARAREAVGALPAGSEALVSSAYLYDLADEKKVNCQHADWVGDFGKGVGAFRPRRLVLTAYDYYRRYRATLEQLTMQGKVRVAHVEHDVHVLPPDAFPRWRRVVQHVSWAPVIVDLEWP